MILFLILSLITSSSPSPATKGPTTCIGTTGFYDLLRRSNVIVDKTLFIKSFLETTSKVLLVTYPKKNGKSVNLDMIKKFLQIEAHNNGTNTPKSDRNSTKWFFASSYFKIAEKDLTIRLLENGTHVHYDPRDLNGEFPVISLDLYGSTSNTLVETVDSCFRRSLLIAFREHFYLFSALVDLLDAEKVESGSWHKIKDNLCMFTKYISYGHDELELSQTELEESLLFLSTLLHNHWKKKVFILVDEYDYLMEDALTGWGFSDHLSEDTNLRDNWQFLQRFFENTFQRNVYLEKALVTSTLRVEEGGLLAKVQDVKEFNCVTGGFTEYYGFTKPEVTQFLEQHEKLEEEKEVVKWYEGYNVQGTIIYNPWSIVNFVDDSEHGAWLKHNHLGFIFKFIYHPNVLYALSALLTGEPIKVLFPKIKLDDIILLREVASRKFDMSTVTDDVTTALLNFALQTGYLTPAPKEIVIDAHKPFFVTIPNKDIRMAVQDQRNWPRHFPLVNQNCTNSSDLTYSLKQVFYKPRDLNAEKTFASALEKILPGMRCGKLQEHFTSRAVIAALVALRIPEVKIVEAEFGFNKGHVDLVVIFKETVGVIFEFTVGKSAKVAHDQLKSRNYSILQFSGDRYKKVQGVLRIGVDIDKYTKHVMTMSDIVLNDVP